ncbi:MAG: hypothetical protein GY845_31170 [Planctomycetes bacterium]|nr:hypothetical protein [Planctomycetota bacterium]
MYNPKVITINKNNHIENELFIGEGHRTCVIANVGTSTSNDTFQDELDKAKIAIFAGADIITDHSLYGEIPIFHTMLRNNICKPLSAIPAYELSSNYMYKNKANYSIQAVLELVEEQLARGINMLTLHATVLEEDIYNPLPSKRLIPVTSKGGWMMMDHMRRCKCENPFFSHFNYIIKLMKKYNAIISLGTTYRPASICDASLADNDPYWIEVKRMSTLVKQAIENEVFIMIEGIGHAKLTDIPAIVQKAKMICYGVPYRILSVSTDIAYGYDNISSAIASSMAALSGANVISAISSAEHVGLPSLKQTEEAVVSARIAGHCADICTIGNVEIDQNMSRSRNMEGGCHGVIDTAIYPKGAQDALMQYKEYEGEGCTMCGKFCALNKNYTKIENQQ